MSNTITKIWRKQTPEGELIMTIEYEIGKLPERLKCEAERKVPFSEKYTLNNKPLTRVTGEEMWERFYPNIKI